MALVIVSAASCRCEFIRTVLCWIDSANEFAPTVPMAETMTKACMVLS